MNDRAPTYDRNSTLTWPLTAVLTAGVMLLAPGVLTAQEAPDRPGQEVVQRLQQQYGEETVSSVEELESLKRRSSS